jgi:protein-S-isoprenylcysteine O-methyltransferase Ste14
MIIHPLIKIPCVLLATAGIHASNFPPNPRVSKEEGAIVRTMGERLLRMATSIVHVYMLIVWLAAFVECAVIIARTSPSLPLSQFILRYLLFGRDGSHIRLTTESALALLLTQLGARIRTHCYEELGKSFTFELSIRGKEHELVTTGLYGVVRHPSYAGYVMNTIGITLLHGGGGSWVRESGLLSLWPGKIAVGALATLTWVVTGALLGRMKEEDQELQKHFGARWHEWAAQVRYSLIPGVV